MQKENKRRARTYPSTFYAGAGAQANPPSCISLRNYCAKYFLSKPQVLRLLKKKELCAVSFKKKLFIVDQLPEE
ncbi:MAG: hypothetical protein EAZ94_04245 [Oscillatoriales cyanobacterium]|nr:MAG: hypothetical protein EAZ94_04245 [Oscillatoriales cyanobacterium]TAE64712.1 MAG: hypothetical protein EAZ86_26180 [Oscillatoriales cyanobacterium]